MKIPAAFLSGFSIQTFLCFVSDHNLHGVTLLNQAGKYIRETLFCNPFMGYLGVIGGHYHQVPSNQ